VCEITNGHFVDTKHKIAGAGRRTALEKPEGQLRVEMTQQRLAAYGHRTFNAGFPTMNLKGPLSQLDPLPTSSQ
jgi:hypothetical protein